MIDRNKYVVFKREDYERILTYDEAGAGRAFLDDAALDGCVVFRLQDTTARFILEMAAGYLSLLAEQLQDDPQHAHLVELADYYTEMAEKSRTEYRKKLPD